MDATKEQVKQLWKLCFDDTDAFVDMYFDLRYREERTLVIREGERVVSALQVTPYRLTAGDRQFSAAYISGACTHPDFRGRGLMGQLLEQTHRSMLQHGAAWSFLIPGEPWLFRYYERFGYEPAFFSGSRLFVPSSAFSLELNTRMVRHEEFDVPVYDYLNRRLHERPFCVQQTADDFRVLLADLRVSDGFLFTLESGDVIRALVIGYRDEPDGKIRIDECVSDDEQTKTLLLSALCRELHLRELNIPVPPVTGEPVHPLGMARLLVPSLAGETLAHTAMSLMLN
jgi:predicted N-acetyltransferase YhbS